MIDEKLFINLSILWFFIFTCIVSSVFRYENKTQFFKDCLLGFTIGCSCYLLLNNWFIDTRTKVGITGIVILCSKPLYDWSNVFIRDWLTKLIMKRKKQKEGQLIIEENTNDEKHNE